MVTSYGETPVVTAAKPAPQPLQVLLVGNREEDFFLIREILERNRCLLSADLDHARSIDEACNRMNALARYAHKLLQDWQTGVRN